MATFIYPPVTVSTAGLATEAKQDDIITEVSSINTKTPALGTALIAASTPVNIASDQVVPVSASSLPLPAGASTSSLQTSGNASLTTIAAWDTNAGAVGAGTQRVHLTTESLAALEDITVTVDTFDVFDTTYVDASSTAIPGNASAPLELVASVGSDVKKLQFSDTTGSFLEIRVGASSGTLKVLVGPGSDQTVEVDITSGTRISVRRADSASSATVGSLAINYIG